MALPGKLRTAYIVIHEADAHEAARENAATRARAVKMNKTLPADARPFRTLREWRELLAASGGLQDPTTKTMRPIPLAKFAGADPERTWLKIGFAGGNVPYESYTIDGDVLFVHRLGAAAQPAV